MNTLKLGVVILGGILVGWGGPGLAQTPTKPIVVMTAVPKDAQVDGKPVDLKKYKAQDEGKKNAAKTCANRQDLEKFKAFLDGEKAKQNKALQAIKDAISARYKAQSKTSRVLLDEKGPLMGQLSTLETFYDVGSLAGCFLGGAGILTAGTKTLLKKPAKKLAKGGIKQIGKGMVVYDGWGMAKAQERAAKLVKALGVAGGTGLAVIIPMAVYEEKVTIPAREKAQQEEEQRAVREQIWQQFTSSQNPPASCFLTDDWSKRPPLPLVEDENNEVRLALAADLEKSYTNWAGALELAYAEHYNKATTDEEREKVMLDYVFGSMRLLNNFQKVVELANFCPDVMLNTLKVVSELPVTMPPAQTDEDQPADYSQTTRKNPKKSRLLNPQEQQKVQDAQGTEI